MTAILVSGLVNVETTVRADSFPIDYAPVRYPFFGVRSAVSGVGYNIARALRTLGDEVRLVSMVGPDAAGGLVRRQLQDDGITTDFVLDRQAETAQSVVLFDAEGRRMIYTDLKDAQEIRYPEEQFAAALDGCKVAVLSNINYSRPFLHVARTAGLPIVSDVHVIGSLDDAYNQDFMAAATVLFQSHERLPVAPEQWAEHVIARFGTAVVVIGLGAEGALLAVRDEGSIQRIPAVQTRPIVNTIGAGDALLSSFTHFYAAGLHPYECLRRAVVFASYKIGEAGAGRGFLGANELEELYLSIA